MQHVKSALDLPLPEKPEMNQGSKQYFSVGRGSKKSLSFPKKTDLSSEFDQLSVSTYYEDLDSSFSTEQICENFGITPLDDSDLKQETSGLHSLESSQNPDDDNYEDLDLIIRSLLENPTPDKHLQLSMKKKVSPFAKNSVKSPVFSSSPASSGYVSGPDSNRLSPVYCCQNQQQLSNNLAPQETKLPIRKFPKTSTRPYIPGSNSPTLFKPSKIQKNDMLEKHPRKIKTFLRPSKLNNKLGASVSKFQFIPPTIRLSKSQTNLPYSARTSLVRTPKETQCNSLEKQLPVNRTGTSRSFGTTGRLPKSNMAPVLAGTFSGRVIWHETSI